MSGDGYTISRAARRLGISDQAVRSRIGKDLIALEGRPLRVQATEVEEARAEALAKFENVIDTTEGIPGPTIDPAIAQRLLATHLAANEMLDEGLETARRALRLMSEAAEHAIRPQP